MTRNFQILSFSWSESSSAFSQKIQSQFFVNPINFLVIPSKSLIPETMKQLLKSIAGMFLGKLVQAINKFRVLLSLWAIIITASFQVQRFTRLPDVYRIFWYKVIHNSRFVAVFTTFLKVHLSMLHVPNSDWQTSFSNDCSQILIPWFYAVLLSSWCHQISFSNRVPYFRDNSFAVCPDSYSFKIANIWLSVHVLVLIA